LIRPFNKTDLHALHRMICETIDASYSGVYPPRAVAFFKEYHSEKKITERNIIGKIMLLISESDDSILATGSLTGSEIYGVFVRPGYQRKGYGKSVMTMLEHIAIGEGITELSLSISLPSKQFYEHLGYKIIGECALDVGEGECLKYWSGKKKLHT
jgi:GNAT superfamily N-acetyltransferase